MASSPRKLTLIVCLISLALACAIQAHAADVDWSDPTTIDPYDANIGDFLDTDTAEFAKKAYDAYQAQDYENAARYYLAVLRYDISDGSSIYNLACCYGLLGRADLAAKYLKRSVKAGFEDIEHIKVDPDFDKVRTDEVFKAAVEEVASLVESKTKDLGELVHFSAPSLLECRVHLPQGYDPKKAYPLIVGLHGYGSNHNQFNGLWKRFADLECIFATPQAPYPFIVGKEMGYSWGLDAPGDEQQWRESAELTQDYVTRVVRELCKTYKTEGVYLLGFSQGCAFAYLTGIKNASLFGGLMCFGGWLETDALGEDAIKAAKGLRVFIAQGKQDRMVEYGEAVKSRDLLTKEGYDVTFYDFEGGHTVPEEACHKAVDWIKAGS